jgi:hypothetical protein
VIFPYALIAQQAVIDLAIVNEMQGDYLPKM